MGSYSSFSLPDKLRMIRFLTNFTAVLCVLMASSCYTDDSSGPNPDRLPFEDFNGFFSDNNAVSDTLSFSSDLDEQIVTSEGTKVVIPENAFSTPGTISMEIKEMTKKSDFLFLNKPTLDGNTIIESGMALYFKPFTDSGELSIENPLNVQLSAPSGVNVEDMNYYFFQGDWTKDDNIDVMADGNILSFESERTKWQMAGKELDTNGTANLSIAASGYGTVPHDMRAFAVGSQNNIVLPLDFDLANVTASGTLPKGIEFNIVLMTMDHFKLSYGAQSITLTDDMDMDLQMRAINVSDMVSEIKSLD